MSDIITERSGNILRVQLNRPERKNAMTSAMYITLADLFNNAAKDDEVRVVLCMVREIRLAPATTYRIF
jgi:enoyl-CoA hydratase/carnithine racemase